MGVSATEAPPRRGPEVSAPTKGPLGERCDFCGARPGERCRTKDKLIGDWYPDRRQPHAARVRRAEKELAIRESGLMGSTGEDMP